MVFHDLSEMIIVAFVVFACRMALGYARAAVDCCARFLCVCEGYGGLLGGTFGLGDSPYALPLDILCSLGSHVLGPLVGQWAYRCLVAGDFAGLARVVPRSLDEMISLSECTCVDVMDFRPLGLAYDSGAAVVGWGGI